MSYLDDPDEQEPALDERELPDEADMSPEEDDEEAGTEPCPFCWEPVHEQAEVCPYCHNYLTREEGPSRKPLWLIGIVICLIVALIIWAV